MHNAAAQSLQRQTLSCAGGSSAFGGSVVQICVGQPSNTMMVSNGYIRMQQGFLQPIIKPRVIKNKLFNIYPNPATKNVFINGDFKGGELVIISTIHGQILDVKASLLNNNTMILNISNLKAGAYALQIRNHAKIMQSTILIKNQ